MTINDDTAIAGTWGDVPGTPAESESVVRPITGSTLTAMFRHRRTLIGLASAAACLGVAAIFNGLAAVGSGHRWLQQLAGFLIAAAFVTALGVVGAYTWERSLARTTVGDRLSTDTWLLFAITAALSLLSIGALLGAFALLGPLGTDPALGITGGVFSVLGFLALAAVLVGAAATRSRAAHLGEHGDSATAPASAAALVAAAGVALLGVRQIIDTAAIQNPWRGVVVGSSMLGFVGLVLIADALLVAVRRRVGPAPLVPLALGVLVAAVGEFLVGLAYLGHGSRALFVTGNIVVGVGFLVVALLAATLVNDPEHRGLRARWARPVQNNEATQTYPAGQRVYAGAASPGVGGGDTTRLGGAQFCAGCGHRRAPGENFCPACGSPLQPG